MRCGVNIEVVVLELQFIEQLITIVLGMTANIKSNFYMVEILTLHKVQSKVKNIVILILAAAVVHYNC